MEKIAECELTKGPIYFLPPHAVLKHLSGIIRVVVLFNNVDIFVLTWHIRYGTASIPFLAIISLQELANDI